MIAHPAIVKRTAIALYRKNVVAREIAERVDVDISTVRNWARAAGCPARSGGRRAPTKTRKRALQLYATKSSREIGKELGIAPTAVTNWARAAGIRPGPREHHRHDKWVRELAVKWYRSGTNLGEIARMLHLARQTVRRWAKEAKVPPRAGNGRQNRTPQ